MKENITATDFQEDTAILSANGTSEDSTYMDSKNCYWDG